VESSFEKEVIIMTEALDQKTAIDRLIGHEFEPVVYRYKERDAVLYALGVGAPADWLDQDELRYVYELSAQGFRVLPTFPVLYGGAMINWILEGDLGGIKYNPMMLVHGEQYLELHKPPPASGTVICYPKIAQIYDKGSGLVVVTNTVCNDERGEKIANLESSMFIRGLGGFGGERGPSGNINLPPEREPDVIHKENTLEKQALIYRLSGDINPLHADPAMAAFGGFSTQILHGLCTFGFAARAVLKHFCGNDPARFKSIKVRFAKPVIPGETLVTEMWKVSENEVIFQTKVVERNELVLTNAKVGLMQ
jgi:3-hydroxyacyl-CoA dehydrogenase/3a,7a,12a-trihydroxy-5b-cholest-24-enoyl-CoA hydratase